MIHDATVEITCDYKDLCRESEHVALTYFPYHGYDDDDREIERKLVGQSDWIVRDGKHYCCEEHAQ